MSAGVQWRNEWSTDSAYQHDLKRVLLYTVCSRLVGVCQCSSKPDLLLTQWLHLPKTRKTEAKKTFYTSKISSNDNLICLLHSQYYFTIKGFEDLLLQREFISGTVYMHNIIARNWTCTFGTVFFLLLLLNRNVFLEETLGLHSFSLHSNPAVGFVCGVCGSSGGVSAPLTIQKHLRLIDAPKNCPWK